MKSGKANIICPYCGVENSISIEYQSDYSGTEMQFTRCYIEDGGCDKQFILNLSCAVIVSVFPIGGNYQH